MNFYIGYFQQIDQLPKTILPISTAIWQPKWLPKDRYVVFKELSPEGIEHHDDCVNCPHDKTSFELGVHLYSCEFLKEYKAKLESLNWSDIESHIKSSMLLTDYTDVCFMVYEMPNNPCSERWIIKDVFKLKFGITVLDFSSALV